MKGLTQTIVFLSVNEESHKNWARTYGNSAHVTDEDYYGEDPSAVNCLWMTVWMYVIQSASEESYRNWAR